MKWPPNILFALLIGVSVSDSCEGVGGEGGEKAGSLGKGTSDSRLGPLNQLREPVLGRVDPASEDPPTDVPPLAVFVLGLVFARLAPGVLVEHGTHACEPGGHRARREDAEADEQQEEVVLAVQVRDAHVAERVPHLRDGPPRQLRGLRARGILIIYEEKHSRTELKPQNLQGPESKGDPERPRGPGLLKAWSAGQQHGLDLVRNAGPQAPQQTSRGRMRV